MSCPPSAPACATTCVVATPVAALSSKEGALQKAADWALGLAIPVHMHITTNAVVTDYVPTRLRGALQTQPLAHPCTSGMCVPLT